MKIVNFGHQKDFFNFKFGLDVKTLNKLSDIFLYVGDFRQVSKDHTKVLDTGVSLMMIGC